MYSLLFVAAGGALGALCRYFTGKFASAAFGSLFPMGTLIVNVLGSFVIAGVYATQPSGPVGDFAMQGFCGALTTFSTFSLDSFRLFQQGYVMRGAANVLLNLVLGLSAALLGLFLFRVD